MKTLSWTFAALATAAALAVVAGAPDMPPGHHTTAASCCAAKAMKCAPDTVHNKRIIGSPRALTALPVTKATSESCSTHKSGMESCATAKAKESSMSCCQMAKGQKMPCGG